MTEYFQQALSDYERHANEHGTFYMDAALLLDIEEYYEKKGLLFEAEQAMRIAERLHPDNDEVKISRAYIEKNKGNWEGAFGVIRTVVAQEAKDVQLFYAEYEVARNELNAAELRVKDAMPAVMEAEDYDWYLDFGEALVEYGYPERALKYLLQLPANYTFRLRADELIAEAYNQQENYAKSVEYEHRVIDADPYNANAWVQLANMQQKSGDYLSCVQSCDYALAIDEHNFQAMDNKVFSLFNMGDEKKALECCEQFMAQEPGCQSVRIYAGERYFINGEYEKAIKVLREALRLCSLDNPDRSRIISALAFCYMRLDSYETANELLRTLTLSGQSVNTAIMTFATACFDFNQKEKAVDALREIFREGRTPSSMPEEMEMAQQLMRNECYAEARDIWTNLYATKRYETEPELAAIMARAFYKMNMKPETSSTVTASLLITPGFLVHYFGLEFKNYDYQYIIDRLGEYFENSATGEDK